MDRCEEYERFQRIDAAFRAGDLRALQSAVDDPSWIPNGPMPLTVGPCLCYAIQHSPLSFIGELLAIGADPNPKDHDGFPPLVAALYTAQPTAGSTTRTDVLEILDLLLSHGADPNQRGVNDYTALHVAVEQQNMDALRLLLDAGADPRIRTRIDDLETARDLAEGAGHTAMAALLRDAERRFGE